jgi:hypothetical protein
VLLAAHCHRQTFAASTLEDSFTDSSWIDGQRAILHTGLTILCKQKSIKEEEGEDAEEEGEDEEDGDVVFVVGA